jgi:hypothetical protein
MEIKVEIKKIENKQLKEIEIEGKVYKITNGTDYVDIADYNQVKQENESLKRTTTRDINENLMEENKHLKEENSILKAESRELKDENNTLQKGILALREIGFKPEDYIEKETKVEKSKKQTPQQKYQKRWRDKGKKSKYFDTTYMTYIRKDEIEYVKKAILHTEVDYIPSMEGIMRQTGLSLQRVRSTLHWLKKRGEIKPVTTENRGTKYIMVD